MCPPPGPSDSHTEPLKPRKPAAPTPRRSRGGKRRKAPAPPPAAPKPVAPKAVKPQAPKAVPAKPVTAKPKAAKPKAAKPAAPKPVAAKPVPTKPIRSKPTAAKPEAAKPVPTRPIRSKRSAAQPKAAKPVPTKPIRSKPTAAKPAAPRPVAAKAAPKVPLSEPTIEGTPVARDPLLGQTIGRCRIEELVGLGRTARVYRAHYEALDDVVAVKVLRADVAKNPVLVERFQSEARAIAKVDNENVLKIYDVGTTDNGQHYMVVELLEGEEIYDLIERDGQVDAMDAMRIIRQAANGLAAAHGHNLVHRDIKPQNLFLLDDGTVKVVDFGLATNIDDTSERVGTPHYMAPEVCEAGNAEAASDIYGLGIVLFHLLVGQPPYAGKDIKGILHAHIAGKPLRPERRTGGISKETADLVRTLTKRDALLRPTAAALVDMLDAIGGKDLKQKESLKKRTARSRARSAVARREKAGKGTPAIAAIMGAVALVGILIAVFGGSGDDDDRKGRTETAAVQPGASDPDPTHGGALTDAAPEETREEIAKKAALKATAAAEAEGKEALGRVEAWARANWHAPADTDAVIAKYRYVRDRFEDTKAGEEAKRRVKMIKRKKLHPHPDREWTSADALAEARALWRTAEPQVVAKIQAFDYDAARALLPPAISDESGRLARELDYWRSYVDQLIEYRKAAVREITNVAQDEREIETADGEGTIKRITTSSVEVLIDRKSFTYTWPMIGAAAMADLTLNLFSDKADLLILQMAFTYAHELDAFWDAQLELGSSTGARKHTRMMQEYEKRFRARAAK